MLSRWAYPRLSRLSRWLGLARSARERSGLALEAAFLLVAIRLALRWLRQDVLQRWLARLVRPGRLASAPSRGRADRLIETVAAVGKRLPGSGCLAEALAAWFLLRRRGIEAAVRIGVAPGAAGKLAGHAWLEVHDGPAPAVLPSPSLPYLPLPRPERRLPEISGFQPALPAKSYDDQTTQEGAEP